MPIPGAPLRHHLCVVPTQIQATKGGKWSELGVGDLGPQPGCKPQAPDPAGGLGAAGG